MFNHMAHLESVMDSDCREIRYRQEITWSLLSEQWNEIEAAVVIRHYDIFDLLLGADSPESRPSSREFWREYTGYFRRNLLLLQADSLRLACLRENKGADTGPLVEWIHSVAETDVRELISKDKEYGSSWKRRGGAGAFMMMCRKWDRLPQQITNHDGNIGLAMQSDHRREGIRDDVGDLRRYLMLIEAEMIARDLHDRLPVVP